MTRSTIALVAASLVAGGVGGAFVGIFAFIQLVGGSGEPRQPISAPTLAVTETLSDTPTPASNQRLFHIVPDESEARYIVDETDPRRIGLVGKTDQVAGDILVDFDHPASSQVGTIRINMRT